MKSCANLPSNAAIIGLIVAGEWSDSRGNLQVMARSVKKRPIHQPLHWLHRYAFQISQDKAQT
jgi:hypothetical protein